MLKLYSPTASRYSGGRSALGSGINKIVTGQKPGEDDKTQHMIGNSSDQAESTTKPTRVGNLKLLPIMDAPCRRSGRLSLSYDGSSSRDCCWRHEVNTIGNTNQDVVHDPPHRNPLAPIGANGVDTRHQPEMAEAIELVDINQPVHLFLPSLRRMDQMGQSRGSEGNSTH